MKNKLKSTTEYATKKAHHLWKDFKAFITRGNILDMAVGVIVGGAFNLIVTSFTKILMSICTWGVPGGINGLVTVLPAVNAAQSGENFAGQFFSVADVNSKVISYAAAQGKIVTVDDPSFLQWKDALLKNYTLHGTTYTFNGSNIIDCGTFINAIISFLIIALTLFVIVKVVKALGEKRKQFMLEVERKAKEEYFKLHPEEREKERLAKEKEEQEKNKKPEDIVLLTDIKEQLIKLNSDKASLLKDLQDEENIV